MRGSAMSGAFDQAADQHRAAVADRDARFARVRAALRAGGMLARGASAQLATSQGSVELLRGSVRVAYEAPEDRSRWETPAQEPVEWAHVSVRDGLVRVPRAGGSRARAERPRGERSSGGAIDFGWCFAGRFDEPRGAVW